MLWYLNRFDKPGSVVINLSVSRKSMQQPKRRSSPACRDGSSSTWTALTGCSTPPYPWGVWPWFYIAVFLAT